MYTSRLGTQAKLSPGLSQGFIKIQKKNLLYNGFIIGEN